MDDLTAVTAAFDFVAEHTSDIILRVGVEGRLEYVSHGVRAYGYEPKDILGLSVDHLVHPDDADRVRANIAAALRGEPAPAVTDRQNRYLTANGEWVWLEGNPKGIRDADGRVVGMVTVLREVTEARLREEMFEAAFQHAAIGKALVGLDGRFQRVNQSFCRIVGYPEEVLLARDFQSITYPDDLTADLDGLRRLQAGKAEVYQTFKRYRRSDGGVACVHLTVAAVRLPDGSPKGFVTQIVDQSEQRAAEAALRESEARYRLIAENTGDMIAMSDLEGVVTYISPSVRQIGSDPGAMVGRSFRTFAHPEDIPVMLTAFKRLLDGQAAECVRWRGRHGATGEWIWMESRPSVLRDPETGQPTGFLDVARDVSLQVEQERALTAAHAEAEAAAKVKAQFLANMSHEIRTPLTAVVGYADLLTRQPSLGKTAQNYVGRISGAASALLAIVNDILDFSKLEAGKFEIRPHPMDARALARETLTLFASQAAEKGLALNLEIDPALPGELMLDGDRLRQVLINLMGNAVKFTDRGSVTLRAAPASGGREVRFEVKDTGPGLRAEQCARLFQRFTQFDGASTRRHGGTGLGLAICKGIAEAMGGEIGVSSGAGRGSVFHLTVPAAPAVVAANTGTDCEAPGISGLRLLVVDDNAANRDLAARLLGAFGADVWSADGGAAALRRLSAARVDAVLLDLRMPGLDGREVLRRLRATPGVNRRVPVLAFTADVDASASAELAGFDGLVRKPITPRDMAAVIARAVASGAPEALAG